MNAPTSPHVLSDLSKVMDLEDKYTAERGRVFMSGIQALVRLPMMQRARDVAAGKNTAGFVSGYRGSPLGSYDLALWKAKKHLQAHHVVFQPGVNEELAATAVWGTQQLGYAPAGSQKYDGVFSIWYGKGPGVDRCSDVFKHANMSGTTPWGGVIAVAGDDHVAKSSTIVHQSDHIFKACGSPVFFPSSVQEILDLGLHAFAMSRFSGLWAGMKTIQEVVESSSGVDIDADRVRIVLPQDFPMPDGGLHIRWPDHPLEQEVRLFNHKWYAALAYIRANRLNYNVVAREGDVLGIIASGKAYNDTRQALMDLGMDETTCHALGVRLHKVGVVWPLEAQITREFATGLREILVVEEKRQIIEYQLKEELYNWRADVRPDVLGKFDDHGGDHTGGEWSRPDPATHTLLPAYADLSPAIIARAIVRRMQQLGLLERASQDVRTRIETRLSLLQAKESSMQSLRAARAQASLRQPWFCSGCPHNTSTVVPEGSRAMAGIGCHYMTIWMDRRTLGFTQMGGEGVPWVGQQPFSHEQHIFANLGDGTYFHSGLLAIRQSIAAGVNITYKILYNDAVAMTGGQMIGERPEGHSVLQIVHSLQAEGVQKITIVTDEPDKYHPVANLLGNIAVVHRDQLDAVQREFRTLTGTTVIVYDQTCATEKRRRRKRGTMPESPRRVMINEMVCEGCGDCGEQSNCLSIEPLETEFGRKRTINQSSCTQDLSCLRGFCPSFVTIEGGRLKKKNQSHAPITPEALGTIPEPAIAPLQAGASPYGIVVAGVGGTGVITIGQLLGVAAHLEGKGIVTQDAAGLAQKGGSTWSHVLLAAEQSGITTTRVGMVAADLILGCDPVVTALEETTLRMRENHTQVVLNQWTTPTAAFVHQPDWQDPTHECLAHIQQNVGAEHLHTFNANALARHVLGDTLYINPMILGFAWQKGWIPLQRESLMQAMALNAVSVQANQMAFEWGRQAAYQPAAVQALTEGNKASGAQVIEFKPRPKLAQLIQQRVEFLTAYQNHAYAQRYRAFVDQVQQTEQRTTGKTSLSEAVARNLFKLMAYKDEYEVARLQSDPSFLSRIAEQFEGDYTVRYHLAPPLWARKNDKGELIKEHYGSYMLHLMKVLRHFKGLRGTWLDPFGYQAERRTERALIKEYCDTIREILPQLDENHHALALEIANLPQNIRGYGHVKHRHLEAVRTHWQSLLDRWRDQVSGSAHCATLVTIPTSAAK